MRRLRLAILLALGVRVALIALAFWRRGVQAFLVDDSRAYLSFAQSLTHGAFRDWNGNVEVFRTPGYPLLLTPGILLDTPIAFAIVLNLLLTIVIVRLVHEITHRLAGDAAAGLAVLLVALEPTLLTWSLKVMPETALACALLLFLSFALQSIESRRWQPVGLAAASLATAAYVKPIAWPLVWLVALCAFSALGVRRAALFTMIVSALIVPWHLRNQHLTGFAGFSSVMDRAVYLSAGASVAARREGVDHDAVRARMLEEEQVRGAASAERQSRIRRKGLSLLRDDPFGYARTHVAGMLRTLFDPGAAEYLRILHLYDRGARQTPLRQLPARYPLVFFTSIALALVLLPLLVLTAVTLLRRWRDPRVLAIGLVTAYMVLAGGGVPGNARFRAPIAPLLVILTACLATARQAATASRVHSSAHAIADGRNRPDV